MRPWSTAFRIPTDRGPAWLKANGPGGAHEGPLLELFRERGVAHVLLPLAVHPERPWILFDDGGPTLRQTRPGGAGDHDLVSWERILREYAVLQRSVESEEAVAAMLQVGTPDARPVTLPRELARLLDDDVPWGRLSADEREAGEIARRALGVALPEVIELAVELEASGVPASVQHDDLHGGNIMVGPAGDRIFDWGDAVLAHPFSTLTTTFNSIAHKTGLPVDDPAFVRLEAAYLEAWSDVAPPGTLGDEAALARVFGCVGRALAWERALDGADDDEIGEFGEAVAGWLIEFANRLSAVTR